MMTWNDRPEPTLRPETLKPEAREPVDPNDPGREPNSPGPGSVPTAAPGGFTILPLSVSGSGGGSGGVGGFAAP